MQSASSSEYKKYLTIEFDCTVRQGLITKLVISLNDDDWPFPRVLFRLSNSQISCAELQSPGSRQNYSPYNHLTFYSRCFFSNSHQLMSPKCSALALCLILFPNLLFSCPFLIHFLILLVVTTLSQGKLLTWLLCPGLQWPIVKSFLLFFVFSQLIDHSN